MQVWDFSAHKAFRVLEGHSLTFRFETFNFANYPVFSRPAMGVGTGGYVPEQLRPDPRDGDVDAADPVGLEVHVLDARARTSRQICLEVRAPGVGTARDMMRVFPGA
jgi:hypothetical protein